MLDLGCGHGHLLRSWAHAFGSHGVGVDIRLQACARARELVQAEGLDGQLTIVCQNAAEYGIEAAAFEVAVCLGSTFIWGGYAPTLRALRPAIPTHGHLVIGERYWCPGPLAAHDPRRSPGVLSEAELLRATRQAGFDLVGLVRSTEADWDAYVTGNWRGWRSILPIPSGPRWSTSYGKARTTTSGRAAPPKVGPCTCWLCRK